MRDGLCAEEARLAQQERTQLAGGRFSSVVRWVSGSRPKRRQAASGTASSTCATRGEASHACSRRRQTAPPSLLKHRLASLTKLSVWLNVRQTGRHLRHQF